MKLLLLAASTILVSAAEYTLDPSRQEAFPEPVVNTETNLDIAELIRQNPQKDIWYRGGIVGLFAPFTYAPQWTVPAVEWVMKEVLNVERWGQPGTGTGEHHPHCGPLHPCPPPPCGPLNPCNPPGNPVPEPQFLMLIGIGMVAMAYAGRRREG